MSRLLLLCGSQRAASLNARLLDELARLVPPGIAIDRLSPAEVNLPLFDQDQENESGVRAALTGLHARFAAADGIMLASPEYNGLMTPYLKNIVDWVSRLPRLDAAAPNVFLDKPVLLASATPGWSGGGLGIPALRALLGHVGAIPFGEAICLPYAEQAWLAAGQLDPALAGMGWADCVHRFCALVAGQRSRHVAGEAA